MNGKIRFNACSGWYVFATIGACSPGLGGDAFCKDDKSGNMSVALDVQTFQIGNLSLTYKGCFQKCCCVSSKLMVSSSRLFSSCLQHMVFSICKWLGIISRFRIMFSIVSLNMKENIRCAFL